MERRDRSWWVLPTGTEYKLRGGTMVITPLQHRQSRSCIIRTCIKHKYPKSGKRTEPGRSFSRAPATSVSRPVAGALPCGVRSRTAGRGAARVALEAGAVADQGELAAGLAVVAFVAEGARLDRLRALRPDRVVGVLRRAEAHRHRFRRQDGLCRRAVRGGRDLQAARAIAVRNAVSVAVAVPASMAVRARRRDLRGLELERNLRALFEARLGIVVVRERAVLARRALAADARARVDRVARTRRLGRAQVFGIHLRQVVAVEVRDRELAEHVVDHRRRHPDAI